MRLPIRLTIALTLAIAVISLVLGAMVPVQGPSRSDSPYLSVLSEVSVQSAEAVPCHRVCNKQGGNWFCVDCEGCGLVCDISVNGHHCDNISGLCP